MSLVLEEFYNQVPHIGVSSTLGKGFDKIMPTAEKLKQEYFDVFLPELMGRANRPQEDEDESAPRPAPQGLPTNSVGPDKQPLITAQVQEQSTTIEHPSQEENAPAEGTHELEQLD